MPPSGFSAVEVLPMEQFLQACARALESEGRQKKLTPTQAAAAEVSSISRAIEQIDFDPMEASTLVLLREFYSQLVNAQVPSWDGVYYATVQEHIQKFREKLLKLHI